MRALADPSGLPAPTGAEGRPCPRCGAPFDARPFDDSGFAPVPGPGDHVVLARFELPEEYCGVLDHFTQYTDAHARSPAQLGTPTLEWQLQVDGRPLDPYLHLRRIVNPWGGFALPLGLRLDPAAVVELLVRRVVAAVQPEPLGRERSTARTLEPAFVGGRIVGRCWYDPAYGGVGRR